MVIWLLLTVLCSSAAVAISIPLIRRYENTMTERRMGVAIYQDQLQEVERDMSAGAINSPDAELAKIEIQRRLLATSRSAETTRPLTPAWKRLALISCTGLVILGGVNLYAYMGSPELSTTAALPQPSSGGMSAAQQASTSQLPKNSNASAQPNQVDGIIEKLAQRLKNNPDDAEGWRMLGWSYFNRERYQDSVDAYAKAVALEPHNVDFKSAYAESLVQAAQGIVTPSAQMVLEEVLIENPKEERARFYNALGREQAGDQAGALDRWLSLLADAPLDARWREDVRQRVADLGKATNRDVSAALALPSLPASNQQQLGQADENAVVDGMIAKLADRLDKNPTDRDGWAMMIRSLLVKGDKASADEALAKALEVFRGDAVTIAGLKGINVTSSTGAIATAPPISEADSAAVLSMPEADQQAMIKGMVERLAARLEKDPNDSDGWVRLMRAYMVMQDRVNAKEAMVKALAAFAEDAPNRQKIEAAAVEIGMK